MRRIRAERGDGSPTDIDPQGCADPGGDAGVAGRPGLPAHFRRLCRVHARPCRPAGQHRRSRLAGRRFLFHDGHDHDRRLRRHRAGLGRGTNDRCFFCHARADLRLAAVPRDGVPADHPAAHRGMARHAVAGRLARSRGHLRVRAQRLDRGKRIAAARLEAGADRRRRVRTRRGRSRGRARLCRPARRCIERAFAAHGCGRPGALGHRERRAR